MKKHTISALVENEFGVLARVSNMFAARGYNIESLTVAETLDSSMSLMTIVTKGDDRIIEQILKQLNKLINVIKVSDVTETDHVERELVLLKVAAEGERRTEALRLSEIFRGKVVDVSPDSLMLEFTGDENKLGAVIDLFKNLGIREVVRTGKVAMQRSPKMRVSVKKTASEAA